GTFVMNNDDRTLYFFFSSRRRHTRLQGDWSSDVCSSDLPLGAQRQVGHARERRLLAHHHLERARPLEAPPLRPEQLAREEQRLRSEERRVGKECRSRVLPCH